MDLKKALSDLKIFIIDPHMLPIYILGLIFLLLVFSSSHNNESGRSQRIHHRYGPRCKAPPHFPGWKHQMKEYQRKYWKNQ